MEALPDPRLDERLAALEQLGVLDTPAEDRFDRITALASRLLGMPISLIGLVDRERQWNKSAHGLPQPQWPLADSICRYVVAADAPFEVPDLAEDPRFAENGFVRGGTRFYAGWPLRDATGVPVGALCVLDDQPHALTSDQREVMESLAGWAQAELNAEVLGGALAEVRQNERRLLALLDQAPAAVLVVGADGVVEFANAPATRLLAPTGSALPGTPLPVLLPGLRLDELEGGRRQAELGSGRRLVQRGSRGDGTPFSAEVTVSVTGGQRSRFILFVRDLSAEQRSETELAVLRQRTEIAFDALAEGVLVVEPDGRVSFGNLALSQMVQRRRADLPGLPFHELVHPGEQHGPECELHDPLLIAGRSLSPVELRRRNGSSLPVELSVRLLAVSDGEPGVVVTVHDLTERLRVERMKNELISAVSHELRTPLTSIRGSLSLLRAKVIDPASEQGERMIDIATSSTERLGRLVNDILDLERLQAGKVQLELAPHPVSTLLHSAAQAVSGAAVAAGVTLDVLDTDERVMADSDRVVQILVNLLGNAVKFSPSGSTVTLSTQSAGGRVLVSVIDRGRGIPDSELERVFDRFAQVDAGDSREYEGTGLGLAIAKGLAEQHGGDLTVTSEVGVGSTFVLALPSAGLRRRLLAYAPADEVPDALAAVLADRGWNARPARAGDLERLGAGALMLAPGDADELDLVRRSAARLRLPLLTLASPTLIDRAEGAPVGLSATGRVLVVEDDSALCEVLVTSLAGCGLQVASASNQVDAVQAVRDFQPDLLVLDVRLDGGDGFGVVDDLRRQGIDEGAPILVYSVLELDEADRERLQTGATTFLTKSRDAVEDVVHDVVALLGGTTSS